MSICTQVRTEQKLTPLLRTKFDVLKNRLRQYEKDHFLKKNRNFINQRSFRFFKNCEVVRDLDLI